MPPFDLFSIEGFKACAAKRARGIEGNQWQRFADVTFEPLRANPDDGPCGNDLRMGVSRAAPGQGEVEVAAFHALCQCRTAIDAGLYPHLRVRPGKTAEQSRKPRFGEILRQADPHPALHGR
jgi:hypothetical protein